MLEKTKSERSEELQSIRDQWLKQVQEKALAEQGMIDILEQERTSCCGG